MNGPRRRGGRAQVGRRCACCGPPTERSRRAAAVRPAAGRAGEVDGELAGRAGRGADDGASRVARSVVTASTGSIAAPASWADVNARSRATSRTMTASGMRKAIATIEVTAAETSASVILIDVAAARIAGVLSGGVEHHADAAHRVQVAGPGGGLAELAPQPRDVHVDGLVVAVGLVPHLGQQFPAGYHRAGPRGQVGEQVELAAR